MIIFLIDVHIFYLRVKSPHKLAFAFTPSSLFQLLSFHVPNELSAIPPMRFHARRGRRICSTWSIRKRSATDCSRFSHPERSPRQPKIVGKRVRI